MHHKYNWVAFRSTDIKTAIRAVFLPAGPTIGFTTQDISARHLQAGGATSFLTARVDLDTIRIIGRWRSNTILHYLHTTSKRFTDGLTVRMFQYGDYVLIPPAHAAGYRQAAPPDSRAPSEQGFLGAWYRISEDLVI